ncbi:hypothetical protein SAMN05216372_1028 [Pseudomonas straminea]|uniref:Glycosyl transferase n=1 Tax=Pseudomonas straminea TaxID=47882 RepID=A0A1I1SVF6_PSEOC|nr:hypothetical protein SAMN05216372_1028 [Pseudomonas straminea]
MHNFCTLFDSHYLSRGLAMYESLKKYCSSFHLYIFSFDDDSYNYLVSQSFEYVTVISLSELENPSLLAVKPGRSRAEYCWTCTPQVLKYSLEKFSIERCTYLDADLYFYSDPGVLINEMGDKSVLITEHRYSPRYDQSAISGIYCVQFMTFRNDSLGLHVLNWWVDACLEWCFARCEDGRFGDQKYLDDWLHRFSGVHSLEHVGGGVAPWNVQQYDFLMTPEQKIVACKRATQQQVLLIFYHFHGFKFMGDKYVELGCYEMTAKVKRLIYKPYLKHLLEIESAISNDVRGAGRINSVTPFHPSLVWGLRLLKRKLVGHMNFHSLNKILSL